MNEAKHLISNIKAQFNNERWSCYEELNVRGMLNVLRVPSDSLVGTYLVNLHKPWTSDVVQLGSPKCVVQSNFMQRLPFAA